MTNLHRDDRPHFWQRPIAFTRTSAHLMFAVLVWPLLTVVGAVVELIDLPYYSLPLGSAFMAALAGVGLLLPDMLLSGALVFWISYVAFRRWGVHADTSRSGELRLGLEPLVSLVAILAGVALWYPGTIHHSWLAPIRWMPAAAIEALLFSGFAIGVFATGRRGCRTRLAALLVAVGVLAPVPLMIRALFSTFVGVPSELVILGVDGVSQADPVTPLRDWVTRRGGTWYSRPVAPGLLTNSVWTSILTLQPVSAHGVFHTFQRMPDGEPALLRAARKRGYRTVAVFPDQLTCSVGSRAGFEEDRGGPVGWRQVLLTTIANNSLLVPLVRPVLPRAWPSAIPPNHAGTFTYDVGREVREILRAGSPGRQTLVAAHLTYTHLSAYPATRHLSWAEIRAIAGTKGAFVHDRSFDWQDVDQPQDPVKLHAWKLRHLQRVIEFEVEAAGFIGGKGRLILFSDHGDRAGLTMNSFRDERYHRVVLATFGFSARCSGAPVSLIDIAALAELENTYTPAAVEFTLAPQGMWPDLVRSARLRWSGDVDLDASLLAQIRAALERHEPWSEPSPCRSGQ